MVKTHRIQGRHGILSCAFCTGVSRVLLKKNFLVSFGVLVLITSLAVAEEPIVVPAGQFPRAELGEYMQPNRIYENAAVKENMLGITSGTIYAEAVYEFISCPENKYLTEDNTCENCPGEYPNSIAGATAITQCYKMVNIPCTQNDCSKPDEDKYYSVTCASSCACGGGQYTQYVNSSGTGDGNTSGTTSQSCTKSIVSVTCKAGYYQDGIECKSCPSTYPNSDDGNSGGVSACYRSCTASDVSGSSEVSGIYHQDGSNTCAATSCEANRFLNDGNCPECNVSFISNGNAETSTSLCPDNITTKSNATATSQTFTRTCYHQTSAAGSTSSSQCTGEQNCDAETYGTCSATSCSSGYYLSGGACSACSEVANTTETESRTEDCDIPYGKGSRTNTFTCDGYYTGGAGESNDSSACTGCSKWNQTTTGTCYVKSCDTTGYEANATLTACDPIKYTVVYNANATGATGTTASSTHTYNEAKALTGNGFTNGTKRFLGWSTSSTATSATYTNEQSVSNLTSTNGATVNLYAVWGDCVPCSAGTGANCTLSAQDGVCTYETSCKGGYHSLTNNGEYNPSCTANTYTVVYNANATSATGTTASSTHTYDEAKALNANGFTNGTKKFQGWSTSSTSTSATYINEQSVSNLTTINGATVNLYAVWGDCMPCSAGTGANCALSAQDGVCIYETSCKGGYYNITNDGTYNPSCSDVTSGYYSPDEDNDRYECKIKVGSAYTESDGGRDEKRDCYRSCTASDISGSSEVSGIYHQDGANTCAATKCSANTYLNNGTCSECNVSFTDSGFDATSTNKCADGTTTKSNATATSQAFSRTCYHQTSNAGATSSSQCTGTQSCGAKSYDVCTITGCAAGYYLSAGACVAVGDGYYSADGSVERSKCPDDYPNTDSTTSSVITACYKTVPRGCTQTACTCPGNSTCTCSSCSCETETYKQYVAADGVSNGSTSGITENQICVQEIATTTCEAGHYMKNGICTACAKGTYKAAAGNAESCTAASDGYYVDAIGAISQEQCPVGYRDGSNGGRDDVTDCYKKVVRGCIQEEGSVPTNCAEVTEWKACTCGNETYNRHVASNGTSDGDAEGTSANLTCTKTPNAVTAQTGYYVNGTSCTACPSEYPSSAGGNVESSQCYYTCPSKSVAHSTSVTPVSTKIYNNGSSIAPVCTYNVTCAEGYTVSGNATANPSCILDAATIECPAGKYLPANETSCSTCPANSYCVGNTFNYPKAFAQGITDCPDGLVSPQGTTSAGGCGKVMYVDNTKVYLTSEKQTTPALAVKVDGKVYYANTTAGAKPMSQGTTKSLRTKIDGVEYSIHDNTVQGE